MEARVQALRLRVAYVLNTHTHRDHVAGNGVFHQGETKLAARRDARVNPDIRLEHGSLIEVGQQRIEVLFTPGHYLDAICLLVNGQKLITGDTGRDYGPTPFSTIGHERAHNPFLQRPRFQDFMWLKERGNRGRSLSWTFFTRGCRGPGRARKAPMTDRMACSH